MKSLYKYFLIAIIATTLIPFSSCKKGENDKFLSLSSRKARLEGTWKLTGQTYKITEIDGNISTTKDYTYDGTNVTVVTVTKIGSAPAVTNTIKYSYTESITITKENTYIATILQSGVTASVEGNWSFLGKNKAAELKNKEAFVMNSTKTTIGTSVSKSAPTENSTTMVLDKLTKSEMVVLIDELDEQSATEIKTTVGTRIYAQ